MGLILELLVVLVVPSLAFWGLRLVAADSRSERAAARQRRQNEHTRRQQEAAEARVQALATMRQRRENVARALERQVQAHAVKPDVEHFVPRLFAELVER